MAIGHVYQVGLYYTKMYNLQYANQIYAQYALLTNINIHIISRVLPKKHAVHTDSNGKECFVDKKYHVQQNLIYFFKTNS